MVIWISLSMEVDHLKLSKVNTQFVEECMLI